MRSKWFVLLWVLEFAYPASVHQRHASQSSSAFAELTDPVPRNSCEEASDHSTSIHRMNAQTPTAHMFATKKHCCEVCLLSPWWVLAVNVNATSFNVSKDLRNSIQQMVCHNQGVQIQHTLLALVHFNHTLLALVNDFLHGSCIIIVTWVPSCTCACNACALKLCPLNDLPTQAKDETCNKRSEPSVATHLSSINLRCFRTVTKLQDECG